MAIGKIGTIRTVGLAAAVVAVMVMVDSVAAQEPVEAYNFSYIADEGGKLRINDDPDDVNLASSYDTVGVSAGTLGPKIEAVPNTGYIFDKWDDGSEDPVRTDIAESDTTVKAVFKLRTYTITVSADPETGGTVSGGRVYAHGETVEVVAVRDPSYNFVMWTEGGGSVSADARYIFNANADRTLVANFVAIPDTILIGTFAALDSIGKHPAYPLFGNYKLTADIDASASTVMYGGAGWASVGWRRPVGEYFDPNVAFTGSFDGNGFEINGLFINRPAATVDREPLGLFGYTHGAKLSNVRIVSADITGNRHVGALVGYAYNTVIENCYSSGAVKGSGNVGGLVGFAEGSDNALSVIRLSYSSADVGGVNRIGGFIGSSSQTSISECYALGSVASSGESAGGFVGEVVNRSLIANCYAMGDVSGVYKVGGFVGEQSTIAIGMSIRLPGNIRSSYSAGAVTGTGASIGGFAGTHEMVLFSYWDKERSGQSVGSGGGSSTDVIGLSTSGMTRRDSTANLLYIKTYDDDDEPVWSISNSYPYLKNMPVHTVTFRVTTPGGVAPGGTVGGDTLHTAILNRESGAPVRAAAELTDGGESFDGWYVEDTLALVGGNKYSGFSVDEISEDGLTIALSDVTAGSVAIEARFAPKMITLTYIPGRGGKILIGGYPTAATDTMVLDTARIQVPYHTVLSATALAEPDSGYVFGRWRDGLEDTTALRIDTITAAQTFSTAFSPRRFSVTYNGGDHGWIYVNGVRRGLSYSLPTNIPYDSATVSFPIEVRPDPDYVFIRWSDGRTDNPRIDTVRSAINVTAVYELRSVAVLTPDRSIPQAKPDDGAMVLPPAPSVTEEFTAGPNPAKRSEAISIFRTGRAIRDGWLTVYDASGNLIRRINVRDDAVGALRWAPSQMGTDNARRIIGSWDLRDAKGRTVAEGTYLVRGTVKTLDGKREKVSLVIGVR